MSTDPDAPPDSGTAPGADSEPVAGRIVVGVDDSEQAAAALRWALAEGALRGATVEVVHSWSPPLSALPFGATLVIPVDEAAIDSAARASVDELVDAALAEMDHRPPEVLRTILPGVRGRRHAGRRLARPQWPVAADAGVGGHGLRQPRRLPGRDHPGRRRGLSPVRGRSVRRAAR
jgi:nucleotide-binding universal stress UspA family protein